MGETIKYLTQQETEVLFDSIDREASRHRCRNLALFKLAKYCALRAGEMGMLLETDLDLNKRQIYCRREKGSYSNTLRLLDMDLVDSLQTYLEVKPVLYPDSPYLFPSQQGKRISRKTLDYLMKKYCRHTTIPPEKHHFHVLKHTRAVELGELDLDIKEVQWWLGHKNIANTIIYAQFTTNQQKVLYDKYLSSRKG